jgi:SAM-dependent methyltransferase
VRLKASSDWHRSTHFSASRIYDRTAWLPDFKMTARERALSCALPANLQDNHMPNKRLPKVRPSGWFKIPELQDGRFPLDRQMRGLDVVREAARSAAVLDLGCAEGLISLEMAKSGAKLVHGVELLGDRLVIAENLFRRQFPGLERQFIEWDLGNFENLFLDATPDAPREGKFLATRYDIVLCLAIAQKLSTPARFLRMASALCSNIMAVRLPYPVIDDPRSFNIPVNVTKLLSEEFVLIQETEGYPADLTRPYQSGDLAWLGIFRRISRGGTTPSPA